MTMITGNPRSRRLMIIVVTLSLVSLGAGAAMIWLPSQTAGKYMANAQAYVEKDDLSAALVQLRNAAKREPGNAEARYQLASISLRAGDPASSEKEIKVALDRGLSEARALPILAQAYFDQGKYDVLLKTIPESNRSPEVESAIRVFRGLSQLELKDVAAAETSVQSSLSLYPQQTRAEIGLARIDVVRKQYESAAARVEKILDQQPTKDIMIEVLLLKGQIRRLDKDNEGAILAFSKLLDLAPTTLRARAERAEAYLDQKMDGFASVDIDFVLRREPTHARAAYLQAVLLLRNEGEVAAYEQLQRLGPAISKYPPSLLMMGQLQLKRQQFEAAQTSLTEYLNAVPDNVEARLTLANLLMQKNLPEQAVAVMKAAPKQGAAEQPQDTAAQDALISFYTAQKRYDLAARETEALLKLQPDNPKILNKLAVLYYLEKDARALDYAERAYELAPRSPSILDSFAYLLTMNGNMERSIVLYRQAYEFSQKAPEIGYHLAVVLVKTDQVTEARNLLEEVLADTRSFDEKAEASKLLASIAR